MGKTRVDFRGTSYLSKNILGKFVQVSTCSKLAQTCLASIFACGLKRKKTQLKKSKYFLIFIIVCTFKYIVLHFTLLHVCFQQLFMKFNRKNKQFHLTVEDFKAFMGLIVGMSLVKLPSIRIYWSSDPTFYQAQIVDIMTRPRFEKINFNLHF